ncbi:MAG: T9SS C-terminal target domain-containing protein [Calditrichaeota bacterium]|nr:MAG: T9SS C-terminal target domain-containing protein [Calditrichota bacterium]
MKTVSFFSRLVLGGVLGVFLMWWNGASAQEFFPLEVGNLWSFYVSEGNQQFHMNMEIMGDTTFSNGHQYYVLSNSDWTLAPYIRVDGGYIYLADTLDGTEIPFYNLNAQIGESDTTVWHYYYNRVTLADVYTIQLFGVETEMYQFNLDGLQVSDISFSREFGPVLIRHYGDPPVPFPEITYHLTGCIISDTLYGTVVGIEPSGAIPTTIVLYQNYPNPFNPSTTISFALPHVSPTGRARITLHIFDVNGRRVRTLAEGEFAAGNHRVVWDGRDDNGVPVASGVYFYRLTTGSGFVTTRKMVLLR